MKFFARMALFRAAALLSIMLCAAAAQAAAPSGPDALVQSTVDDILAVMKKNPDNKRMLRQLAEEKVMPRFDFREMTKLAVGRPWRDATPAQQDSLEAGFRSVLVNTYTAALNRTDLKNVGVPTVDVRPVQLSPNQTEAVVKTLVRWQGGQRTAQVDYRMSSTPEGWKITDVVVEGLSLVVTYRGTFAETINRSGIPGLINALEEKNRAIAGS